MHSKSEEWYETKFVPRLSPTAIVGLLFTIVMMLVLIRKIAEMNCYLCEKTPGPSGTHFHVKAAVGVCHNCGVGVCAEHSHKDEQPGAPLLCPSCAELRCEAKIGQLHSQPVLQTT